MAMRQLMTVTNTFCHRARGMLELQAMFSAMGESERRSGRRKLPTDVSLGGIAEIRRPEGSKFEATYRIISAHFIWENRLDHPARVHIVMLKDCDEADIPPGSEVWIDLLERAS
jgi:hypothetical protein